jgi:bifunctional N-acetylglucosamine-1-phosphate-uridyltransferase/glucosamine-1-phosphate-acetyltransferase GlmU-like protein
MSKVIKFEEKKKNFQNQSIISKNDLENKKRTISIIEDLYNMFDRSKLDPILETFKSNEMLKEFYMKRIFELMKVKIDF